MTSHIANLIAVNLIKDAALVTLERHDGMGFKTEVITCFRAWEAGDSIQPLLIEEVISALRTLDFHIG
jgi:hypothetical protein